MKTETCWWISWEASDEEFELHSPWWVSGFAYYEQEGEEVERATICAAVRASTEEEAKAKILAAHDGPVVLEWRFCSDKGADYNPFTDRFPRADWMVWPVQQRPRPAKRSR